jgi:hyperosmotically inducible periplasmic protein
MSRRAWTHTAAAAGVLLALGAAPAMARQSSTADRATRADDKAREATSSTGEKITDAWLLTKVKAQFVGEDALKDSDIDVDVRDRVVTLKGTVASRAGKARAAEIARATEGVTRVENNLRIGVAKNTTTDRDRNRGGDPTIARGTAPVAGDIRDEGREARGEAREAGRDMKDAAHDAKTSTRQAARDAKHEAKKAGRDARHDANDTARDANDDARDTARNAGHETREATGTAGQAVSDGWITTKVKSSFVGVDVLDGSDIDVDTSGHVVTLRGTVPSEAARTRALSLAKRVDGVTSVKDELKISAKK